MRDYLNMADVLGIHQALLDKYGGAGGSGTRGRWKPPSFGPGAVTTMASLKKRRRFWKVY
jgi:hypothetical protein